MDSPGPAYYEPPDTPPCLECDEDMIREHLEVTLDGLCEKFGYEYSKGTAEVRATLTIMLWDIIRHNLCREHAREGA